MYDDHPLVSSNFCHQRLAHSSSVTAILARSQATDSATFLAADYGSHGSIPHLARPFIPSPRPCTLDVASPCRQGTSKVCRRGSCRIPYRAPGGGHSFAVLLARTSWPVASS